MYWYEDEVKRLENDRLTIGYDPETLFFGSSSVRLWTSLYEDFKELKPANLGFGGSTLAACVWFFERIMLPYRPKKLVVYAGDNDLGDGRHPEEVFIFFLQLTAKIEARFGNLPCYFISLKPSLSRWDMADQYIYTNRLIQNTIRESSSWQFIDVFEKMLNGAGEPDGECFVDDGLHLSEKGYQLWREVIGSQIRND
ncbi:MAG: GDSL family lipase [Williamsia sp.]|nr:GDSL family lipase [Williamsia sp.]